jgi:hypothetical protein
VGVNGGQGSGQGGDDDVEGAGARDDDGLFVECVEDIVDEPCSHARGFGPDQLDESGAAGFAQCSRGAVAFQQPGDGLVVQARAQNTLQRRVELGEQAAYPVAGSGEGGGS